MTWALTMKKAPADQVLAVPRVAVVIATLGRPEAVAAVLQALEAQTLPPAVIVLSVESQRDVPASIPDGVSIVSGPRGLCAQRNRALDAVLPISDIVVFYDDDFVPSRFALERMARYFKQNPDVVGATGLVLADGVGKGGIDVAEAYRIVAAYDRDTAADTPVTTKPGYYPAYGCNMAFRSSAVGSRRFDEALSFYGWQEDVDFSGQIRTQGRVVKTDAFAGVHCGSPASRSPGLRLGYSQVMNPVYLVHKGTMDVRHAVRQVGANFIANSVKSLYTKSEIDRRGRLKGNWLAIWDVIRGRLDPTKITKLVL